MWICAGYKLNNEVFDIYSPENFKIVSYKKVSKMMIFPILERLKDKRMFVQLTDVLNVTFIKVKYYPRSRASITENLKLKYRISEYFGFRQ